MDKTPDSLPKSADRNCNKLFYPNSNFLVRIGRLVLIACLFGGCAGKSANLKTQETRAEKSKDSDTQKCKENSGEDDTQHEKFDNPPKNPLQIHFRELKRKPKKRRKKVKIA